MKKKNIRKLLYAGILSLAIISFVPNDVYAGNYATEGSTDGHYSINLLNGVKGQKYHVNNNSFRDSNNSKEDDKKASNIGLNRLNKNVSLTVKVSEYNGVEYSKSDSGSFFLEGSSNSNINTYYPNITYNAYVEKGSGSGSHFRGTSIKNAYLMKHQRIGYNNLAFNSINGSNLNFIQHAGSAPNNKFMSQCTNHSTGCSAGIGAEFSLDNTDNTTHWLTPGDYGYNVGTAHVRVGSSNSYIMDYTSINSNSASAADTAGLESGTQRLHLISETKAFELFGFAAGTHEAVDIKDDNGNLIMRIPVDSVGVLRGPRSRVSNMVFETKLIPNSSYATFVVPQDTKSDIDTYNIVNKIQNGKDTQRKITRLANGRFVVKRNLTSIIGYSSYIASKLDGGLGTASKENEKKMLSLCSQFTTYNAGKPLEIKVGNKTITVPNACETDKSVGATIAVLAGNGTNIGNEADYTFNILKPDKASLYYSLNSDIAEYNETRKIISKASAYAYSNKEITGTNTVNNTRKYYYSNIDKDIVTVDATFKLNRNNWILFKDTSENNHNWSTTVATNGIIGLQAVAKKTNYTDSDQYIKVGNKNRKYFFDSQGDIAYAGSTGGSHLLSNDFMVDAVYGRVQAQFVHSNNADVQNGDNRYMYNGNTSGFNAIENTIIGFAYPTLKGSTLIKAEDTLKGYKLKEVNTPTNTNISAEDAGGGNFKISITNETAYPIYSVNEANIKSNYTSKGDRVAYTQNGSQTLEAITKTWEQNKYTVHFITNYGYVMSSTDSNSPKTLTDLNGSDRHSFKGKANSSDITFTSLANDQPNGAGVGDACSAGVVGNPDGTAKSVNIGGVTYTYYDKVYAFGSELYTNSMPNVYLRKPGTNAVNNTYKTARANNPSDNTGCVWYIATVGSDGKLQCTFADDDNLFQYLTGFKQENRANSQVAIDLDDGAEIYVVAYWAPTKNKFYLVGDDGIVYVPDSADTSTPITSTDPKAYKAYRNATNNKGDLHSDLNGDGRANELINYVDKFGSGNSGNKFSLGKGLECSYDDTKKLYYVEIYNDATFDKYGKFAGMEEGAVYENGTIMFPTGDTCYGYTFDRPNRRKYDENNNPASWLQWTRFVVQSGNDDTDDKIRKIRDEKNYVSWIENTNTLTGNVTHINLPASYAENANSGICLKITGTQLYTFNGAINDGYDYGTNEDTDNEVFLYATWFPNTYQIEYDGNNNWNYNEILRGGSDAGNKHVESNIYYNKTINLFDGFKRDSSATDNTYNIAGQKLHDNKGNKDDLDEWKLLGYWSTSHGNVNSRINSGAEKQVGNVTFDISLNGNNRSEFNMTPGNPVRGLVDSGSISLKAIWRRAVAVSYDLNGGKTVENKFLLNNAGDKSSGNDTKLYVAGYMWNDDVSIKLKVPYGEVTNNGVNDSIKKDGYRFIGWALDEVGADGTGSYKTYTDGDKVIKSVNSRLTCNENPDVLDSDSTPDLNEALNTIERYLESFTPDGNVYVDIDSVVGDKPNLVAGWDITGEQERWNAGDRSKGCNGRLEISRSVFNVGDGANNPFSTKVGNSEATGNNPYIDYGCGLPSKNLDVYAYKNMIGDLNNDNGYSKDEEIDVTNSVVAHAMWEGILQARVTYSIQNDERKTLQYSAMNKDNYESSYIKREYNGNGTVLCGSLLENSGKLGNDITKAADAIDSVQGGNLFETSVSETTAITDLPDLVMVRQYSSKDVYLDSDGKLVKRGSGSEDTTLDRQYSFDNESKTWSSPISRLTLAEAVKGTYESQNDFLNKPENSEASEDSGLAVVGKIGSGDENKTTLISALNGFNANNQNKYYGFYRQNMFSGSPKLSVDNYDQLYVKYKEYIPLYLHYTMNPNANDRKFLTKCTRGEGGSYVIQTELRKFSFYYSVHSSNNTGNEYKAETIRIPVRLNIYASETNTSGPVPPVPNPPSDGGKGGNDPSHPTSQGGGVKSTLDLPEQTQ